MVVTMNQPTVFVAAGVTVERTITGMVIVVTGTIGLIGETNRTSVVRDAIDRILGCVPTIIRRMDATGNFRTTTGEAWMVGTRVVVVFEPMRGIGNAGVQIGMIGIEHCRTGEVT